MGSIYHIYSEKALNSFGEEESKFPMKLILMASWNYTNQALTAYLLFNLCRQMTLQKDIIWIYFQTGKDFEVLLEDEMRLKIILGEARGIQGGK